MMVSTLLSSLTLVASICVQDRAAVVLKRRPKERQETLALGVFDDEEGGAILHGATRVLEFGLS